eukprot:scaffold2668_cov115-Isochrysis_galbana.AAC.29
MIREQNSKYAQAGENQKRKRERWLAEAEHEKVDNAEMPRLVWRAEGKVENAELQRSVWQV